MFSDIQSLPNQMPAVQNRMYIASVILHNLERAAGMYQSVDIFWGYRHRFTATSHFKYVFFVNGGRDCPQVGTIGDSFARHWQGPTAAKFPIRGREFR